jgi:fused signal recognition particle receptor
VVATEVEKVLAPVAKPLEIDASAKAVRHSRGRRQRFRQDHHHRQAGGETQREGRKIMLAAGDTFRAAAIEQLKVWGERTRSPVIAGPQGSDSAEPCLQRADRGEGAEDRRAAGRHRRTACRTRPS